MQVITVTNDFPQGFYAALGRVAVEFGRVEYEIKLAFKSLTGQGFSVGMAEAEKLRQFSIICDHVKKLISKRLPEQYRLEFASLIDQALALANDRNDNLHALWTGDSNHNSRRYRALWDKRTKKLRWKSHVVTVPDLKSYAEKVSILRQSLRNARKNWPALL